MDKIPIDKYKKLRFQALGQMLAAMRPFEEYGHQLFIPEVAENCMIIAELFCENVRGDEKPITVEMVKLRRKK